MAKIVTMGEIMLRLSPEGNDRFIQSESFRIIPGGGEANVAISCANYGHDCYFVSKLPKHEIGQIAVNALRRYGVNTEFIARGGDRIGLYYAETGASMRPSKVIYDRAHSAIAEAQPSDWDFDKIFEGADWFHWSGITPAISDESAECLRQACICAKKHGVKISVDLNFRKKLWTSEKAISIMRPLMQYVDVCIGNEEDAELCLGFKPDADVEGGETNAAGYEGIFKQMKEQFGFEYVVSTLRESFSATHNGWKALIYDGKEFYQSKRYDVNPIIDRIGGGDSFSGGLIHGLLTKATQGEALEFAVAASALKHTINGDFNLVSVDEVEALAGGAANGRVQR
ncbi:MAG: sugar kinase [Bacteroidaceae bacterium]|jgi:2-dehydro-3-deoxygluconokinase|nr:sugar kinase [Bacteroidaceae bacterium]